ncbi:TPA: hypothetical protein DCZ31_04005 [Patescibacteria group bacterium]|nr:hypothetical protein [Candidatus Gracilibacteria bacterium]
MNIKETRFNCPLFSSLIFPLSLSISSVLLITSRLTLSNLSCSFFSLFSFLSGDLFGLFNDFLSFGLSCFFTSSSTFGHSNFIFI